MPTQTYLENPGLSFHKLNYFTRNGAGKFRAKFIDKDPSLQDEPKDNFRKGRLWHTAILEPELLKDWTIIPRLHYTPKGNLSTKKETSEFLASIETEDFCSEMEMDHVVDCAQKIHNRHVELFHSVSDVELEETATYDGVPIKYCADMLGTGHNTGRPYIGDVKTITDLADRFKHIEDLDYIKQLAWYHHHLIGQPKAKEQQACILWVEKETGQSIETWISQRKLADAHTQVMCDFQNYKRWTLGKVTSHQETY